MYLEGSDQHRGWFQSSLLVSMGIRDRAPYKTVLTHGFILDEKGEAMSKSRGNVISPLEIIDKLGADVLRLWVASEDYRNDIKISKEILDRIAEAYRRIRNTLRFLLGNLNDFDPAVHGVEYSNLEEFDRWALHQLATLTRNVRRAYEAYEFHKIFHYTHKFCVVQMSSIYLDVLKDRLYCSAHDDQSRRAAQTVLHNIAITLMRLLAPVMVFTADEAWRFLTETEESVHLEDFPTVTEEWFDQELNARWEHLLEVREIVLAELENARKEKVVGHPLDAKVTLRTPNSKWLDLLESYKEMLADLFIVSAVELEQVSAEQMPHKVEEIDSAIPVAALISKAPGEKCERCWHFATDVGSDQEHPTLCGRCINVLRRVE